MAQELSQRHNGQLQFVYEHALKGFSAQVPAGEVAGISHDPRVAFVEVDQVVHAFGEVPTGVDRIEVDKNGTANIDGSDDRVDVDVAILDTGIDKAHPDLNVVGGVNCSGGSPFRSSCEDGNFADGNGHGTHVAGTVAALDNGSGVVGVAPGARLWAVKVLNDNGSGYMSWIVAGIDWVTANSDTIEVANMSLGCECSSDALDTALYKSTDAGVVYAVAAGNSSKDAATFSPANHPQVIATSAMADFDGKAGAAASPTCRDDVGNDDTFATFSNFGDTVDIAAPGVCIESTIPGGGYASYSGTSMASPHTAGAAALYIVEKNIGKSSTRWLTVRDGLQTAWAVPQSDPCGFTGGKSNEPFLMLAACDTASGDSPPSVAITNPADGATVSDSVTITADASDDIGVTQVEFFVDGVSIGADTDSSDGWSTAWDSTSVVDGSYTLTAEATDTASQTSSDAISVTVDNVDSPPSVALTNPAAGAIISGTVSVTADATDDNGVSQVEFFDGVTSLGIDSDGSDGWSVSWDTTTASNGEHALTATATDTAGQTASDSVNVTVDNTPPTVEITSPSAGATVSGTIDVTADASDTATSVAAVEFFVDGASLGTDSDGSDGWSVSWNTASVTNGDHNLTAVATDAAGNTTTSVAITVTVSNDAPSEMHVGDLDGSSISNGPSWTAIVTILIVDSAGNPVADASVSGDWSNGASGSASCTTTSDGTCQVSKDSIHKRTSSVTFTVSAVTHASLTYDASVNTDPDGASDGTKITVFKP